MADLQPLDVEAVERAAERLEEAAHNAALAGSRAQKSGATQDVRTAEHRRDILRRARQELADLVAHFGRPAPDLAAQLNGFDAQRVLAWWNERPRRRPDQVFTAGGERAAAALMLLAAAPDAEALFAYKGGIYVRPLGRGICYGGIQNVDHALEDAVPEGHYDAEIVIRHAPIAAARLRGER